MSLVTIDLDGTLLASTVFQVVGRELGREERVEFVDELYERGLIGLRAAFYAEYPLFLGVPVERAHQALDSGDWLRDIEPTVRRLREAGHEVWVVTDQPDWAVAYLERFGINEGVYSRTTRWAGETIGAAVDVKFDKLPALQEELSRAGIEPEAVTHVGNGTNDIPVFEAVGGSIAFNPSTEAVSQAADATIRSDSLEPVLDALDG